MCVCMRYGNSNREIEDALEYGVCACVLNINMHVCERKKETV